jgi:hypothetical protein
MQKWSHEHPTEEFENLLQELREHLLSQCVPAALADVVKASTYQFNLEPIPPRKSAEYVCFLALWFLCLIV